MTPRLTMIVATAGLFSVVVAGSAQASVRVPDRAAVVRAVDRPAAAATTAGETTAVISVSTDGDLAHQGASYAQLSDDGREVVFASGSQNLDESAPGPQTDDGLFVRNTVTGVTHRVDDFPGDLGLWDATEFQLSPNGEWVVYTEIATGGDIYGQSVTVYLENLQTDERTAISSVPTDPLNQDVDVYKVALSANANEVAFSGYSSDAENGWHESLWLYDRASGQLVDALQAVDPTAGLPGLTNQPALSADGSVLAFTMLPGNLKTDPQVGYEGRFDHVFVMSTAPGSLPHQVVTYSGDEDNGISWLTHGSLSAGGDYLGFTSTATNWTASPTPAKQYNAYILNLASDVATRMTTSADATYESKDGNTFDGLSDDGKTAVFDGSFGHLVPQDYNVYLWDRATGTSTMASLEPDGLETVDGGTAQGMLSGDGEHISFEASVTNAKGSFTDEPEVFETTLSGASQPNLSAIDASKKVSLVWSNPAKIGRLKFDKVIVRGAHGTHAPKCPRCGFAIYRGRAHHAFSRHLHNGHFYSYSVFTKNSHGHIVSRKTVTAKPHKHHKHHKK